MHRETLEAEEASEISIPICLKRLSVTSFAFETALLKQKHQQ